MWLQDGDISKLAYDIAKARILVARENLEGANMLLDDAACLIPEKFWPSDAELEQ